MSKECLGNLIEQVDVRNKDLSVDNLYGVSIEKKFIKSIANTIGTDMSTYKIVTKDQFAYGPVTSRNGDKVSIALLQDDKCIISSSYTVFRITKPEYLLPEYLMLFFKRPEFDRYARFKSHGSAREIFDWDEMCNTEIDVPDIKEQEKYINNANVIKKRIDLLKKINSVLENMIDTIYLNTIDGEDNKQRIKDVTNCVLGGTPSRDVPDYWDGDIPWINSGMVNEFRIIEASEYITKQGLSNSAAKLMPKHTVVLAITGATLGQESISLIECCGNQSVIGILENEKLPYSYIHPMIKKSMQELLRRQAGGAQPHINKDDVENIEFVYIEKEKMNDYVNKVESLYKIIENNCFEMNYLLKC